MGRRILYKKKETHSKEVTSSKLLYPSYVVGKMCPRYHRIMYMCSIDIDPNLGVPVLLSRMEVVNMCINPLFFHPFKNDKGIGDSLVILIFL